MLWTPAFAGVSGRGFHSLSTNNDTASEQKPTKEITAFIACDTSHCQRSCCQSAGTSVQLLVAWLAG